MTSKRPDSRAASNPGRVSTRTISASSPSAASVALTRSASCGLSSRWRIFSTSATRAGCGRRFVHDGPESAQQLDRLDELEKVDRLDDVGVDTQIVRAHQILFFA